MMWDVETACKHVLQHYIEERNKAIRCTICDRVLFSYEKTIINHVLLLEVRDKKITWDMVHTIYDYMHYNYPYRSDKTLVRHHINYKEDIQIPVCSTCHNKIHNIKGVPEWDRWKPVDKKPKHQCNFETRLYKLLDVEHVKEG